MTASLETTDRPAYLTHPDGRVQSILVLAESYNDETTLTTADRDLIIAAMLPAVHRAQAVSMFRAVADDLITAADYDTRGEDAVVDRLGAWSHLEWQTGDEKASELRDELRGNARLNATMLVTLQDRLAAKQGGSDA